jgi:hypothetical protein
MPSNDEVVVGVPQIQCPSCMQVLALNGQKVEKFSKFQRKKLEEAMNQFSPSAGARDYQRGPHPIDMEDLPSERPEKVYVVVTCENRHCEQYNKIKILKLPRLHTPSVSVDLKD